MLVNVLTKNEQYICYSIYSSLLLLSANKKYNYRLLGLVNNINRQLLFLIMHE